LACQQVSKSASQQVSKLLLSLPALTVRLSQPNVLKGLVDLLMKTGLFAMPTFAAGRRTWRTNERKERTQTWPTEASLCVQMLVEVAALSKNDGKNFGKIFRCSCFWVGEKRNDEPFAHGKAHSGSLHTQRSQPSDSRRCSQFTASSSATRSVH
jgi:hypothetical protein